jgi:hypothetical protein
MESVHGTGGEQSQLLGVVRGVRARYRAKLALRGAAITIAAGWALVALGGVLMNAFHYADGVVLAVRIVAIATILGMTAWFIVRPLLPKLHDEQVALYLEEHERSLKASVITAVEMQNSARAASIPIRSPALIDRLTHTALERVRLAGDGKAIDAGELKMNGGILAAVLGAAMLLSIFGPPALRNGLKLVAVPWRGDAASTLFSISVEPGNATVAKGGDQMISANLRGFQSDRVELLVRPADSTAWTHLPMTADSSGVFAFRLFDIGSKTQYSVEANGIRSNTYTLDVSNLPFVKQIDLQYRYPAYTQLPPNDVDSTGDIAALKGTLVRVRVAPTVPTTGGRIVVEGGDTLKLAPTEDGKLMAMLRVNQPGFYKVELQGPDGRMVTGSLNYTIDVLPDRPPTVQFTKPGRDSKVLSVDEVYTEVRAQDDYGVAKVDLHFSVNGGPDQTMSLHDGTKAIKDISAGYTFMLEGLKLEPGDVVSYYAHATDNNAVTGAQGASTDIYFLQVRPFENDYRQQQGGGGGGGGGGQQNDANQLSQTQRDIIAATFKTARDSAQTDKKSLDENLATIRLSQQRLREQTSQLASRLVERGIAQGDSAWNKIAQILPKAAAEMDTAEKNLSKGAPSSALQPEQRALAQLQRAEAVFREIQVSMGGGGGGGGGGNRTDAKDLADIFELQKDKLRNQYETVQRGQQQQQQQQADNQVDETAEKLRQLAAREQQENERARAKADSLSRMGQSGASGGQGQRDLAQQTEDEAHKLERLAREQQNQSLADAARRLQDAADAMRRAAANGSRGSGDAAQADKALSDARRLLDQERNGRSSRDLSDAMKTAQQLADQEKKVQSDEQKLTQAQTGASGGAAGSQQQMKDLQQSIADQKAAMANEVKDLKSQLDRMSNDSRRDQKDLSRALGGAADTLRGRKTEEKLRYSSGAARTAPAEWLNSTEPQIASDIADLGQRMQQAQSAAQNGNGQRQQAQAADKTRDLVRGLESMDERMRQRAEQGGAAGQGAEQGRRLQQGQSGEQGQGQSPQGERGQGQAQGQQGQKGQGQAQGQQGQQGQGQAQGQQGQQGQGQQGQKGQGQGQGQQGQQGQGQGQQGQQGQGGQGQNRGQQQANGSGQGNGKPGSQQTNGGMGGPLNPNGVPGGGVPNGRLSPDDAQQFSREAQQRLADAQALRTDLQRQGLATKELDQAIDNLRQLTNAHTLEDQRVSTDLRAKTIEGFKDFEFGLRRKLGESDSTRVLLERSGDVPAAYKSNVEEYYRSIGKGAKKP